MGSFFSYLESASMLAGTVTALSTAIIAATAAFYLRVFLAEKSTSRYNSELKRAELSEMRVSYERDMAELTKKLTATEARWKDANHLLISSQNAQTQTPDTPQPSYSKFLKSLGIAQDELKIDPKLVFVLTPFGVEFRESYEAIVRACRKLGLKCVRGDEEMALGDILSHIVHSLVRARIVIANVSGRNPNVFYELGLAHAFDKPTILIAKTLEGVPFNIRSQRILLYRSEKDLVAELTTLLARTILNVEEQP
jgi:hypothetical protein